MATQEKRRREDNEQSGEESQQEQLQKENLILCALPYEEQLRKDAYRSVGSEYFYWKPTFVKLGEEAMELFIKKMNQHEPWLEYMKLSNAGNPPEKSNRTFVDERFHVMDKETNQIHKIESVQITRFDYPTNVEVLFFWPGQLKPDNYVEEYPAELSREQMWASICAEKERVAVLEDYLAKMTFNQEPAAREYAGWTYWASDINATEAKNIKEFENHLGARQTILNVREFSNQFREEYYGANVL